MLKDIIKSFLYAFRGFYLGIRERNFRIHLTAVFYVTVFSALYELEKSSYIILLLTFSIVIFAELINSSMEEIVDLKEPNYNIHAKNAKDIAAAAVLVTAIASIIIAIILFSNISKLKNVYENFLSTPLIYVPLTVSIPFAVIFIKGKRKWKKK